MIRCLRWEDALGVTGVLLLVAGHVIGLGHAPPERMMGDVARILYVHVPVAWNAMLVYAVAFVAALGYFWKGTTAWDAAIEAAVEVGVVLNAMLLVLGSIWARPTWGVWWDWDPRLTTAAVMFMAFLGVIGLRHLVVDPGQRARWSAVTTVMAFVSVPVVYLSVRWWRSLHQLQSSPQTVDPGMVTPLRLSALGVMFIAAWFVAMRWRVASARLAVDEVPPPLIRKEEG